MTSRPGIRFAALAIACSASAIVSIRAAADEIGVYRSDIGRFSAGFPSETVSVSELTGSNFSITSNDERHTAFAGGVEYAVEIHDIPRFASLLLTGDYVVEKTVEGMLDDIGGRELESTRTEISDHSAREVRFEIPESEFRGRLLVVLAERRLYLVSARHPETLDAAAAIGPFFESFSFWID